MKTKKIIFALNILQIIIVLLGVYVVLTLDVFNLSMKLIIIGVELLIGVLLIFGVLKLKKKEKYVGAFILSLVFLILFSAFFVGTNLINNIEGLFDKISEEKTIEVNSAFFVLKNSGIKKISNLKNKKIGLLDNESDYEGNILPLKALDEENINAEVSYDTSYLMLINNLLDGIYDAIALPTDFKDRFEFNEEFEENLDDFVSIYEMKDEIVEKKSSKKTVSDQEPFSIVLIGTDSSLETHHHNYDVIILLTFNPNTNDLVVTSIYRATGMYSKCIGAVDLVNHNGWKGWGPKCLMQTVEDFFNIDINHYLMIDFKGFVDVVDAIGGITVNVPKKFCESNSDRRWGKNRTICLTPGVHDLNGEQALAFARHRKSYSAVNGLDGGELRNLNHISVIKSVAQKIMSTDTIFKFNKLLQIVQDNLETDMNKDQIYKLYETFLSIAKKNNYNIDKINIIPRNTDGYGGMYYSKAMNTSMGISIIYEKSYNNLYDTFQAVINNNPKHPTYYSIDLTKDPDVIPQKFLPGLVEKIVDPRVMDNLIGKTISSAYAFERKYQNFIVYKVYEYNDTAPEGQIFHQSIAPGERINHRYRMTVKISLGPKEKKVEESEEIEEPSGEGEQEENNGQE